jgi:hypothetical protein
MEYLSMTIQTFFPGSGVLFILECLFSSHGIRTVLWIAEAIYILSYYIYSRFEHYERKSSRGEFKKVTYYTVIIFPAPSKPSSTHIFSNN